MPSNSAAWLPKKQAKLAVSPAPYTPPGEREIVVRNRAIAVNPVDWIIQSAGGLVFGAIKCPAILGSDIAGEVAEVGAGVTRFKVGDRVVAHAICVIEGGYIQARAAFQAYTVAPDHMASPIPDTMSFERASVLPLGLSTAACGLFQKDHLALQYPSATPAPTGQALLIWGGSTSVGANAIQLAVAAGYDVITTASPRNFDYVRGLGASQVFDYNAKTVVKDITKALTGKTLAGALAIGATSGEACVDIVGASRGVKFVSLASFAVSFADLSDGPAMPLQFASKIPGMAARGARLWLKSKTKGVRTNFIFGSSLATNEVGPLIYRDFLPQALADGRLVPAPPPHLVGEGLAYVQTALDLQKKGVSASKLVVSL